jgi:hypothetical protein
LRTENPLTQRTPADPGGRIAAQRRDGHIGAMIKLVRDPVSIVMTELLWEALQELARAEGWHPAGAVDLRDQCIHSTYRRGRVVAAGDARAFANALERLVNGEAGDRDDLHLPKLVQLINFARSGPFEIR